MKHFTDDFVCIVLRRKKNSTFDYYYVCSDLFEGLYWISHFYSTLIYWFSFGIFFPLRNVVISSISEIESNKITNTPNRCNAEYSLLNIKYQPVSCHDLRRRKKYCSAKTKNKRHRKRTLSVLLAYFNCRPVTLSMHVKSRPLFYWNAFQSIRRIFSVGQCTTLNVNASLLKLLGHQHCE